MLHGVRGDFPTGEAGARGAFPPKVCVFSGGAGRDPPPKYSITTCYYWRPPLFFTLALLSCRLRCEDGVLIYKHVRDPTEE